MFAVVKTKPKSYTSFRPNHPGKSNQLPICRKQAQLAGLESDKTNHLLIFVGIVYTSGSQARSWRPRAQCLFIY